METTTTTTQTPTATTQTPKQRRTPMPLNGVDTPNLFATIGAVKAQPELAKFRFRATNTWMHGTYSRTRMERFDGAGATHQHAREFTYDADHPQVLVGRDQGPTRPVRRGPERLRGDPRELQRGRRRVRGDASRDRRAVAGPVRGVRHHHESCPGDGHDDHEVSVACATSGSWR